MKVIAEYEGRDGGRREADLIGRAKGDSGKVALAVRLRAEKVITVKWIAARLRMGTSGYATNLLRKKS